MFVATKVLRQATGAAHAERKPLIKFLGKRTIPTSVDHTPHVHPASPTGSLPEGFGKSSGTSFSSYRQQAQQHGPLGRLLTPRGSGPSGSSLGSVKPAEGQFFDRTELPARFQRTPFSEAEIDAIETGGATLVC